jgi:hypothetical protein
MAGACTESPPWPAVVLRWRGSGLERGGGPEGEGPSVPQRAPGQRNPNCLLDQVQEKDNVRESASTLCERSLGGLDRSHWRPGKLPAI